MKTRQAATNQPPDFSSEDIPKYQSIQEPFLEIDQIGVSQAPILISRSLLWISTRVLERPIFQHQTQFFIIEESLASRLL
jgi:hypothetical protein